MDRDVDSLEHIRAIVSNQDDQQKANRNPQALEEPSYRILPRNESHASSFGAGGTMPHVIDPDFRPPASHVFGQVPDTAIISSNIMSSTLLDYGPPVTLANHGHQNNGLLAPPPPPPPPPPRPSQHSAPTPSHTPHVNPFLAGVRPTLNPTVLRSSANEPYKPPFSSNTSNFSSSTPTLSFTMRTSVSSSSSSTATTTTAASARPQVSTSKIVPQQPIHITLPSTSSRKTPTDDAPLYSPQPRNPSPPLDQITMSKTSQNRAAKPAEVGDGSGKIPKKKSTVSDRYDEMSMLNLQEKFRECEARLDANKKKRADIEKALNDMARNSHGKNIELDPQFRTKKDEQRHCDEASTEIRAKMKKISEKLSTKFNHKILPKHAAKSVMQTHHAASSKRKMARMSTGGAKEKRVESPTSSAKANMLFEMSETKLWCKLCDIHFDSFTRFCEHLHSRDHLRNLKRTEPPWRKTNKQKIDTRRTYDMLKSICDRVRNEVNNEFSLSKLNATLCPPGTDPQVIKDIGLNRERGKFESSDPLLHVKGYENLIPINGFFCQLCDRAYCDFTAIEQHVKSYEHNYRHAISVANDEISERTFRELQEKSYKKQFSEPERGAPVAAITAAPSAPTAPTAPTAPANRATNAPVAQYKKSTSHIVDEHEVVIEKYPDSAQPEKRVSSKPKTTASNKSKRVLESDESEGESPPPRPSVRNRVPDIVPIRGSQTRPSALKRLKEREKPPAPIKPVKKPYISSTESDISEQSVSSPEVQLETGDPDSPFPGLQLATTGNVHVDALKDKRLSQRCYVKMNRINIDDYRHMLMDQTTLWTRINGLMAKREGEALDNLSKELRKKHNPKPTYFTASGNTVPIDLEDDEKHNTDDTDVDEKPKLSALKAESGKGNGKKRSTAFEEIESDKTDNEDDLLKLDFGDDSDGSKKGENFNMALLETFFCDK